MKTIKCNNCGGNEFKELGNGNYICTYCGTIVESERPVNNIEINNYTSDADDFGDDPYYAGGQFRRDYEMGTLKYNLNDPGYAREFASAVNRGKLEEAKQEYTDITDLDTGMHKVNISLVIAILVGFPLLVGAFATGSPIMYLLVGVWLIAYMVFVFGRFVARARAINKTPGYYASLTAAKGLVDGGTITKEQARKALERQFKGQ